MVETMKVDYSEITPLTVLLFVWQLPQCLLGLILYFTFNIEPIAYTNTRTSMTVLWITTKWRACWSLGSFVFANCDSGPEMLKHETGHCLQSLYLGPVYLLAVALPSLVLFWIRRIFKKSHEWYYDHYPENWANKLGGVDDIDNKGE